MVYRRLLALLVLSAGSWGLLNEAQQALLIACWLLVFGCGCLLVALAAFCGMRA